MSHSHLPDDVSRWPGDPYQLLGVPRGVEERELRRAYTRLIRRFKPEHAPEEFRRIRQAYESVQQQLHWRSRLQPAESPDFDPPQAGGSPDEASPVPAAQSLQLLTSIESAWQAACNGSQAEAIATLRRLQQHNPDDEEVAVRMYWLLTLSPELDRSLSPIDVLRHRLNLHGIGGRIGELYRRSLIGSPGETLRESCAELLFSPRSKGILTELLRLRWSAAAALREFPVIHADLDRLRDRLLDEPSLWLFVTNLALESAIAMPLPPPVSLVTRCQKELEEHTALALSHHHLFDRADELLQMVKELDEPALKMVTLDARDKRHVRPLIDLARAAPTWPVTKRRQALLREIAGWIGDARFQLRQLDQFSGSFPALAHSLLMRLGDLGGLNAGLRGPDLKSALKEDVTNRRRILDVSNTAIYHRGLRLELMRFCLEEFADVDDVVQALGQMLMYRADDDGSWFRLLQQDLSLKILVRGTIGFWSAASRGGWLSRARRGGLFEPVT